MSKINRILILIDADSLCFQSSKETLEESIFVLNEKIQNIYEKTQCTHAAFFISKGKYFRHNIDPLYKSSRSKHTSALKYLKTLKSYLEEEYQANWMEDVEADDLIAYWYNSDLCITEDLKLIELRTTLESALNYCHQGKLPKFNFESFEKIICSPDKDLLQSIEGKHFNYTYKLENKSNSESIIKGCWVDNLEIKPYDEQFLWYQMLTGDNADGISGLHGVGPVTANAIIENAIKENSYLPEGILSQYITHHRNVPKAIFEFQKNYRLLHLLSTNLDFEREIGKLPQLPKIIELNKTTTINNNNEIDELFK